MRADRARAAAALLAGAVSLAGCVGTVPPPPLPAPPSSQLLPLSVAVAPPPVDAALARDAALSGVAATAGGLPSPTLLHAPTPSGPVDVATLALPDTVLFDTGIAEPRDGSGAVLDALARAIDDGPPDTVATIAGNTDAVGGAGYNLALSDARARNVAAALAARGVDPRRLDPVGFGRTRPVARNDTAAGRARNRRVEIALSVSFAANRSALDALAPARTLPATVTLPATPAGAIAPRRPAPLGIRPNTPEAIRPHALGPRVPF